MDEPATQQLFRPWTTVRLWLAELLCLTGSVASLCALVAFLNTFHNRPLATVSLPGSVSLNSIAALITIVAKGCFTVPLLECLSQWKWNWFHRPSSVDQFEAFDRASCGLWGSGILLWKLKLRHGATVGAAVYVISVMISLFTQESIAYVPGVIKTGAPRSASVRQVYHWGIDDVGKAFGSMAADAAVMTSLFDDRGGQSIVDVVATCPSANCTYPIFNALSVCSEIVDITSSATLRNLTNVSDAQWDLDSDSDTLYLGPVWDSSNGKGGEDLIRNMTSGGEIALPNGLVRRFPSMNTIHLSPMNTSVAFKDGDDRYGVGLVNMAAFYYNGASSQDVPPLFVFEILFHMCINTYSVTVDNGAASSAIISTYYAPVPNGRGANRPLSCGPSDTTCGGSTDSTQSTSHIAFNTGGHEYSIDVGSARHLGTTISRYLAGWRASTRGDTVIRGFSDYKMIDDFSTFPATSPRKPLSQMVRIAVASLNQVIQDTQWGNSILVWGQAWENTVFIRVQWGWLGLLAGEIGLAIDLSAIQCTRRTRWESRRSKAHVSPPSWHWMIDQEQL